MSLGMGLLAANHLLGDEWLPSSVFQRLGITFPLNFVASGLVLFSLIGAMTFMIVRELGRRQ